MPVKLPSAEFCHSVYSERIALYETLFGPAPEGVVELKDLSDANWPGGCLVQFEKGSELIRDGLCVCATFGLTNADMPARVAVAKAKKVKLIPKVPAFAPDGYAGYGYEMMVLTPSKEDWPLLFLDWLVRAEIESDAQVFQKVRENDGITIGLVTLKDIGDFYFLITRSWGHQENKFPLPNGDMEFLCATSITGPEMEYASGTGNGRIELLNKLIKNGLGQVSILDRQSVV